MILEFSRPKLPRPLTSSKVYTKIRYASVPDEINIYILFLGQKPDGSKFNAQERVYAGHQLAKLVAHPSTSVDLDWKAETICFLLSVTQFELKKPHGPVKIVPLPFSREAKLEVKDTFFKSLDTKAKSLEAVCTILDKVVAFAQDLMENKAVAEPLQKMNTGKLNLKLCCPLNWSDTNLYIVFWV